MILISLILSILSLIVSIYSLILNLKNQKAIVGIVGPKIDLLENQLAKFSK